MISLLVALTLYITPPATRENGAEFWSTEVDYYELYRNGELYTTVTVDGEGGEASAEVLEDGDYQVRVFDVEGLVSELSPITSINNAVRAKPSPPGLGRKKLKDN